MKHSFEYMQFKYQNRCLWCGAYHMSDWVVCHQCAAKRRIKRGYDS